MAETRAEMASARAVRLRVFVQEQGVPETEEYDELDATAHHAVALAGGSAIATGRLIDEEPGVGRIGRMAVDKAWRGRGVGGRVLAYLEGQARAEGYHESVLHAQCDVEGFYARFGYRPEGDIFEEAGIEHITMRKKL
ncbi:MAG: GNAT family N-acetyltransferase [Dehalococcoidia bacterium]|nr:GNAT family N-acetyltransferase [Dehalococcoidia bacterium]